MQENQEYPSVVEATEAPIQSSNFASKCQNLLGTVQTIQSGIEEATNTVQNVVSLYSECQKIKAKTAKIDAWSNAQMATTIARYKVCQEFLERTFGERGQALQRHYTLMDQAIASGDRELILASLQGISSIVTKSPLEDLEKFAEVFNNPELPLLDF